MPRSEVHEGGKMILVLVLPFLGHVDIFLNHGPSSLSTEKTIAVQHDFNTKSWTNVGCLRWSPILGNPFGVFCI